MNFKEFEDGLQVEIEIPEKVPKSLMRHLPALHHIRFRAYRRAGTTTDYTDVKCSENEEKSLPTGRQVCNHLSKSLPVVGRYGIKIA
jgi:hypothetical protein